MERVVLLGAGASHGAEHILPDVPPLGKDFYKGLCRYFPMSWGKLPEVAAREFQEGFEQGMQVLWDQYSASIAPLMQHLTLYLAQLRPDGTGQDLYSRFFASLKEREVIDKILYSTLNYECLLELAASLMGIKVDYWDALIYGNTVRIWKLHGSCNFISANIQASAGVHFTAGVTFEGGLNAVNPNEAIQYCLSDTGLYPAMALYMNAKPIQVGQAAIHNLQKRWGEIVKCAGRVLIIGVKPYPEDSHIWGPLTQSTGELGYVGSKEDFDDWKTRYRENRHAQWLGSRWEHVFDEAIDFISED